LTVLGLLFLPLFARAQALPAGVSPVYAPTLAGSVYTYPGGTVTAANAPSVAFPAPANSPIYTQTSTTLPLGNGYSAPVTVRSRPSPAVVAKAVGNFASKSVAVLAVGVALYDLCIELGYSCGRSAPGAPLTVQKTDPLVCSVGPCYSWSMGVPPGLTFVASTPSGVCAAGASALIAYYSPRLVGPIYATGSGTQYGCTGTLDGRALVVMSMSRGAQISPQSGLQPSSLVELEGAIAAKSGWPSTSALPRLLPEVVASGEPLPVPAPYEITGPVSVPMAPSVTTLPDGSKVTETPEKKLSYGPSSVTVTDSTTRVTSDPSGAPTGTATTTKPAELPQTCGYPGGPACKIDETGTPTALPSTQYDPVIDAHVQDTADKRATIAGSGDKNFFSGWSLFFTAPSPAACAPLAFPSFLGYQIPSSDPCPVVDGVRGAMAYIWALAALWLCIGMIRKVI
jgi:hypothetical protein